MPKTIRNSLDKNLRYEKLMKAHIKSRKGKGYRKEIILFNLKQEEYIMWLYNRLKSGSYKHGGYTEFYVTEPKLRKIKDEKLLWLIQEILYAQPRKKGLEIGNYTSQMFANIYLNEVDRYIKHELKIKYYCRYLDDSVVIVQTKEEAKKALVEIKKFLKENLKLELNKKTQIFKSKQGVNFCGYKINEYRLKIRDKGKRKLKKKIKKLKQEIKLGRITSKDAKKYLAGHLGYIQIANVKNLTDKLFYKEEI